MEDRKMPHHLGIERAVLGACLLGGLEAVDRARQVCQGENIFYNIHHRKIWKAICSVIDRGDPVDNVALATELDSTGDLEEVGGPYIIAEISAEMATDSNIEYHARLLREDWTRRSLIEKTMALFNRSYDVSVDCSDLIEEANRLTDKLDPEASRTIPLGDAVGVAFDRAEEAWKSPDKLLGITTGLEAFDRILGGLQPSDLLIFAGRASMGKTALALQIAKTAAEETSPGAILLVSLEMSARAIGSRMLAHKARVNSHHLRMGAFSQEDHGKLKASEALLRPLPMVIADRILNTTEIRLEAKKIHREAGLKMIVVDYLQLLQPPSGQYGTREQEVASIVRALKDLAIEMDVPVIALSQLSRAVEQRPNKRPMLSDLRESGSIEQDADVVAFIYRPAYYGIQDVNIQGERVDARDLAEIIVAKHRNGPTGLVRTRFDIRTGIFEDWMQVLGE